MHVPPDAPLEHHFPPRAPSLAPRALVCVCVLGLALAGPAAPGIAAAAAGAAASPPRACLASALAFGEALEPVIESVTDGRPERVPPAADRAGAWWAAHRADFAQPAALDSAMRELHALADGHRAPLAARSALVTATRALDACPEAPSDAASLMRIDLAGMAGWLRAHGVNAPFPPGVVQAAQAIGARLRSGGHAAMADGLRSDVAATLAIPARVEGNIRAADALLQRVDEIERVLR